MHGWGARAGHLPPRRRRAQLLPLRLARVRRGTEAALARRHADSGRAEIRALHERHAPTPEALDGVHALPDRLRRRRAAARALGRRRGHGPGARRGAAARIGVYRLYDAAGGSTTPATSATGCSATSCCEEGSRGGLPVRRRATPGSASPVRTCCARSCRCRRPLRRGDARGDPGHVRGQVPHQDRAPGVPHRQRVRRLGAPVRRGQGGRVRVDARHVRRAGARAVCSAYGHRIVASTDREQRTSTS